MSSPTAISASPAESPNTAAFINAIRAGYRVLQDAHGWAVGLRATVVEACDTKPAAVKAIIKHHSLDRAVQLHYAAAITAPTAPAVSEALTMLARRVEAATPSLAEVVADECLSAPMDTSEAIIALAADPLADLREFTAIELHDAALAAAAQRDPAAGVDFHAMLRLAQVAQQLFAEVERRTDGRATSAPPPSRQDDLNARRRHKRSGRW